MPIKENTYTFFSPNKKKHERQVKIALIFSMSALFFIPFLEDSEGYFKLIASCTVAVLVGTVVRQNLHWLDEEDTKEEEKASEKTA